MNIITKFTVATEEGLEILLLLTKELADEKLLSLLDKSVIDGYIANNFNETSLIAEMNSMSNQWLVVYVDDIPAGYAKITSKGERPLLLDGKRAIRIADFGVKKKYTKSAVIDSLLEKCLAICKSYENIWVNEFVGNPVIEIFEEKGFVRQQVRCEFESLPLASVCLIK